MNDISFYSQMRPFVSTKRQYLEAELLQALQKKNGFQIPIGTSLCLFAFWTDNLQFITVNATPISETSMVTW
jgi:hypothetical protein